MSRVQANIQQIKDKFVLQQSGGQAIDRLAAKNAISPKEYLELDFCSKKNGPGETADLFYKIVLSKSDVDPHQVDIVFEVLGIAPNRAEDGVANDLDETPTASDSAAADGTGKSCMFLPSGRKDME